MEMSSLVALRGCWRGDAEFEEAGDSALCCGSVSVQVQVTVSKVFKL